jgi:hypothetical protein
LALNQNKSTDQKIELIAKALIELAKTIGTIERDVSRIKNGGDGRQGSIKPGGGG